MRLCSWGMVGAPAVKAIAVLLLLAVALALAAPVAGRLAGPAALTPAWVGFWSRDRTDAALAEWFLIPAYEHSFSVPAYRDLTYRRRAPALEIAILITALYAWLVATTARARDRPNRARGERRPSQLTQLVGGSRLLGNWIRLDRGQYLIT